MTEILWIGSDYLILRWLDNHVTIPLCRSNKLPILYHDPVYKAIYIYTTVHSHSEKWNSNMILFCSKLVTSWTITKYVWNVYNNTYHEEVTDNLIIGKIYNVHCSTEQLITCSLMSFPSTTYRINNTQNQTPQQSELLTLHEKWYHLSFHILQNLALEGYKKFDSVDPLFFITSIGKSVSTKRFSEIITL